MPGGISCRPAKTIGCAVEKGSHLGVHGLSEQEGRGVRPENSKKMQELTLSNFHSSF
jgi:hypothetical protein